MIINIGKNLIRVRLATQKDDYLNELKEKDGITQKRMSNSTHSNAIEVENLKKHFKGRRGIEDIKAVDGISFQVKTGEVFGLLGTNGAGKTTTINILIGALLPNDGIAKIGGYNIKTKLKKNQAI